MKSLLKFLLVLLFVTGCTVSKVYPEKYYTEHKELLHQTESIYRETSEKKTYAVGFTSLDFTSISIELKTDTVRYIYDFPVEDLRMNDTLQKFDYEVASIQTVITNMKKVKASWINTLDFYVDGDRQSLSFLSVPIKQFSIFPLMQKRKYYVYTFYDQPQAYDAVGRLLDKKNARRLRKVNGQHFFRINERVSYTISGKFR